MRASKFLLFIASILIALVAVAGVSYASVEESETEIYDRTISNYFETGLPKELGIPGNLSSEREVYVFIFAGGAYQCIKVFAKPVVSANDLALRLEKRFSTSYLKDSNITWSNENYSAVRIMYSTGKFGQLSQSTDLRIEDIKEIFRSAGFQPHIIVRVPKYAVMPSGVKPTKVGQNYFWFNPAKANLGTDFKITVSESAILIVVFILVFALIPIITIGSITGTAVWAMKSKAPLETRRRLFAKLSIMPTFLAILLQAPLFIVILLYTNYMKEIADLWFGSYTTKSTMPLISFTLPLLFLALPISVLAQRKIFGTTENAFTTPITPAEKSINSLAVKIKLVVLAVALAIYILVGSNVKSSYPLIIYMMVIFSSQFVVDRILSKKRKEVAFNSVGITDYDLQQARYRVTAEANKIAQMIDIKPKKVVIDSSSRGLRYIYAMALPGSVTMSYKTCQELNDDELDFILAHEFAHHKSRHLWLQLPLIIILPLLIFLPRILVRHISNPQILKPVVLVAFLITTVVLMVPLLMRSGTSKKREFASDEKALLTIRNYSACITALKKLVKYSEYPLIHEYDDLSTHPAISKRIERLKQIAQENGIDTYLPEDATTTVTLTNQ